jgi:hypothetical protein
MHDGNRNEDHLSPDLLPCFAHSCALKVFRVWEVTDSERGREIFGVQLDFSVTLKEFHILSQKFKIGMLESSIIYMKTGMRIKSW